MGDPLVVDEGVVVLESDKASMEVPSQVAGVLKEIRVAAGETANVGDVLCVIDEGAKASAKESVPNGDNEDKPDSEQPPDTQTAISTVRLKVTDFEKEAAAAGAAAMPAAERLAAEKGVDLKDISGTGRGGRVLKEDVQQQSRKAPPVSAKNSPGRETESVPMSRLRQTIANRLVEAQSSAALLTTFNEVDMSSIMALRKEHQEAFMKKHEIKLGFMSFFVKAAVDALKQCPAINAQIQGSDIVYHNYFDIGIAVGGGKGLVVPIIRNAERLSFAEVELTISDFAKRAQSNRISVEELQGGTFTISNGGVYGSMLSTPIVNPPQSGILGMHAIQERPVAVNGEVVIRPIMYIALTYDHRIVDGREAVTFLKRIKECVENPARMLIEI